MTVTDEMVRRFLIWPVPPDVCPDGTPGQPGRTGTNLLTADQARAMLEHVLAGQSTQGFQERVSQEKAELDDRLERLCLFCYGRTFETLPLMERERLNQQRHIMTSYSAILGARIAAFEVGK